MAMSNSLPARRGWIADFLVVLLCLSSASFFVYLFRLDLFRTINSWDERKPVGVIVIKENIVQRRLGDRFLWDRLFNESPVYMGDLIRVAELSAATLYVEENQIELEENTLIRVQRASSGDNTIGIELSEGGMNLSTEGKGLALYVGGRLVQVNSGTVLNASINSGTEGFSVQVSQGSATVSGDGLEHELSAGTMIELDANGKELNLPAVMVTQPAPNARFLKNGFRPMDIEFAWIKHNFEAGEELLLEISSDRNFTRIVEAIGGLQSGAALPLEDGLWYWRLSNKETVFSQGQITVVEASGPALISPAEGSLIYFGMDLPQLCFQWSEIPEASYYILEAAAEPDFSRPALSRQTTVASLVDSSLEHGLWYWRVMAVYPSVYKGSSFFTPASSFRLEQSEEHDQPVWIVPALVDTAIAEPVAVVAEPVAVVAESVAAIAELVAAIVDPVAASTNIREDSGNAGAAPLELASVQQPAAPNAAGMAVPSLPAPENLHLPLATGDRIGVEELRAKRSIDFKWSPVPGANAYILSLYTETAGGRQELFRSAPIGSTEWILDDVSILERGVLVWQVEAINIDPDGTVRERGWIEENSFTLDIPAPRSPSMMRLEQ